MRVSAKKVQLWLQEAKNPQLVVLALLVTKPIFFPSSLLAVSCNLHHSSVENTLETATSTDSCQSHICRATIIYIFI